MQACTLPSVGCSLLPVVSRMPPSLVSPASATCTQQQGHSSRSCLSGPNGGWRCRGAFNSSSIMQAPSDMPGKLLDAVQRGPRVKFCTCLD